MSGKTETEVSFGVSFLYRFGYRVRCSEMPEQASTAIVPFHTVRTLSSNPVGRLGSIVSGKTKFLPWNFRHRLARVLLV